LGVKREELQLSVCRQRFFYIAAFSVCQPVGLSVLFIQLHTSILLTAIKYFYGANIANISALKTVVYDNSTFKYRNLNFFDDKSL
jgi:hypothetical protein